VLGFEQSSVWGWGSAATWGSLIVGTLMMVAFVRWELHVPEPLLRLRIFADRGFAADTTALGMMSVVFVPFFFFASVYSQVSLGKSSSQAGLYLLYFFLGYVIASQLGGRILDRHGARPAIVFGAAISAVGFFLLAGRLTDLSLSRQWIYVAIAGGGIGLMLTPASTDAVNRAPSASYTEVTGITQTARNFGASLGLAVLGTILIHQTGTNVTGALTKAGVPGSVAHRVAASFGIGAPAAGSASGQPRALVHDVQLAFAHSTQTVFYIMAAVMAATFLVSLRWLPRGRLARADDRAAPDAPDFELATFEPTTDRELIP
jgi:fucose permease